MKRILSFILALAIILGAIPINDLVVWADDDKASITSIIVNKTYDNLEDSGEFFITIIGDNLNAADVQIIDSDGALARPKKSSASGRYVAQYSYKASGTGERLFIDGKTYSLGEEDMPKITGRGDKKTDSIINSGENLILTGENIGNLKDATKGIEGYFIQATSKDSIQTQEIKDKNGNSIIEKNLGTRVGTHSLVFKQKKIENSIPIEIEHTYKSIVTVRGELTMTGVVSIFPTKGPINSTVTISADNIESNVSVFLMEKGKAYEYTKENMAPNESIKHSKEDGQEKLIFNVPGVDNGPYEIVVTNRVDPNSNIDEQINKYRILGNEVNGEFKKLEFLVVDGSNIVNKVEIDPNYSSIKGTSAEVKGMNIGRLSSNIYEGGKIEGDKLVVDGLNTKRLTLTYIGGKYYEEEIEKLVRTITIQIGQNATFTGYNLEGTEFDKFNIIVPEIDDPTKLVKDVIIFIEDEIEFIGGRKETSTERYSIINGFTYKEIDYKPSIKTIIPNIIQVDEKRKVTEDFIISITGDNFLKYGYIEKDKLKIKTPEISVEKQENSNMWFDNENIRIYKAGDELEDKINEQFGNIIKIKIKKGSVIPEVLINTPSNLKLQNPLAVESDGDKGSSAYGEIRFVQVREDKTPTITSVTPNVVTTAGEKGIVITGQKFFPGVKVYIDGEEVKNIKRNELGTEIIFDAPAKPESFVQIIVQNEEGGAAVFYPFTYVKTYTRPRFIDFNPKKGTADTLVTIKGENLVLPNPLVKDLSGNGIDKLIGTKVLLGGKDINEYNRNPVTGAIELQDYSSSDHIIKNESGNIVLSYYYYSVILQQGTTDPIYYTIYFDTKTGEVKLTDGDRGIYILRGKGSGIVGFKDGKEYDLTVSDDSIEIDGKTLNIMTPYAVTGGKITGNKVKVINNSELQFTVPPMPREGYYDVTIVNPDTTRDSKTGNNGFYYAFHPEYNLDIVSIQPNEGSVDGGYYITITGSESKKFIDNGGDNKTSVFIGGVKVDPKDVEISIDRKSIIVKVPKYSGDLSTETEMDRKTVPVVVVNPDGGSGKKEDGFSYILPISYPKISNVIEKEGSAAGDITVYVEGSEFRFYEPYRDLNNNLQYDDGEPFTELNGDGKWTDLRGKKMEDLSEDDKKILPRIYFGGQLATIVSFTSTMIEVKTPKGQAGTVDVYLINNDQGISNKVNYTYKASSPKITNVSPSIGKKQGGDKVEILGEGFTTSNIRVYNSTNVPTGRKTIQLVQFGDSNNRSVSNKSVTSTGDKNTGNFSENRTKDIEIGNLTVKYENGKLMVSFIEGVGDTKVEYENTFDYDMEEIFLPINLLKDKDDNSYNGNELVRIKVERLPGASTTSRLRIDRGFSPNATLKNSGHIDITTPNYYTVGKVPVTVINPDGGEAKGEFEYKNPDSNPKITNILKDGEPGYSVDNGGRTIIEVNYLGGNVIEVQGMDFRKPVQIEIGDIKINVPIEYSPDETISNTLRFTMPAVDSKYINAYHKLKVINEDGGTCDSDKIEIRFIMPEVTGLQITKVTPNFGPTSGGTVITIEGKDFREKIDGRGELKVYITKGNTQIRVPQEDIISISIDKIVLRTPAYEAGKVGIKVENPDGGIAELKDAFTYVSNPKINSVVSPEDDRRIIETISIEGGEKIKILGSDFMEGAKVIFVPNLRKLMDSEEATDYITIGADRYVIEGGVDGTEIEVVDGQTILVTTPAGKLGDKGVIVINPDKSATNIYNITYGIPETSAPLDVRAEVVFDQFIRVFWTGVKEAFEYEIYMSEDGGKFEFIGSTELTSYSVQKISPNTKYQFLVRAIGKYGTSKPIKESQSNIVTTGRDVGPKDTDGKLGENTVINRNGNEASIIIGSKDFTSKGMTIDLTRGSLQGVNDISIRIPANIIVNSTAKITVIGKDYNMNFNPSMFKNTTIISNKDNSNAGVVFKILTYKGAIDAKAGNTVLGTAYLLESNIYIGKDTENIEYLNGNIIFALEHDMLKAQSRRLNNIQMVRYDNGSKSWISTQGVNRLGIYTVIGSRR
ncbi:IPT/TIG domain-containing protein [Tissierella pigra]|uniref:Fibronectin type-III domain-containing protein n=1 Tax=Tissierella pigra TaxID=2607614 RepID=A0A6N7XS79_9FIRM|nr:IPT/TIG domain-containing protein [Tissierella pigra]MSU00617.1 hypothetical protein [Tissierella pigra]